MIYENEKLSKYNWFNLGGPARIFFKPNSQLDLKNFLEKHGSEEKTGVLLTNLGTPDYPNASALKIYLKEFLLLLLEGGCF